MYLLNYIEVKVYHWRGASRECKSFPWHRFNNFLICSSYRNPELSTNTI